MKKLILGVIFGFTLSSLKGQDEVDPRQISFPDVPGFHTLICDLHQHTVFSDGNVWPTIRVQEAQKDGLDALAVTEHLEYQPHKVDIPHPDRNKAYEIEKRAARDSDLIVIAGSEITRSMPPGHCNAIFLEDANKLLIKDPMEVFREANKQGAFVFWNHPNWTAQRKDGITTLTDMHKTLISEGLLHGIEVVNEFTYSEEALQICLDNDLTILGTSDIHGLIDWDYDVPNGGHRPVTLVFAEERSETGIKEGLEAGRTVVWYTNSLIGKEENVIPLINNSLSISGAEYLPNTQVLSLEISNVSDVKFLLENLSAYTLHRNTDMIELAPNGTTSIEVKTKDVLSGAFSMEFRVWNAITAPKTHPTIELSTDL